MKAKIFITGIIGEDTSLVDVIRQYKAFSEPTEVEVAINSFGGNINEADAICEYINALGVPITTTTGRAWSAAAKIFSIGATRKVEDKDDAIMIHNPWFTTGGDASELEAKAEVLRGLEDEFAAYYANFLNIEDSAVRALLDNETYLSGSAAQELGFATEVISTPSAVATYSPKNKTMESKKEKKGLVSMALSILGISGAVAELKVQDAAGVEVVFPDVGESDTPTVGSTATIDGEAIPDGSYVMPSLDNKIYKFSGGALESIEDAEEDDDTDDGAAVAQAKSTDGAVAEVIKEVSMWGVEVVNTSYAVGDTIMRLGFDGIEEAIGAGEYKLPDGRTIITDASGVVIELREAQITPAPTEDAAALVRSEIEKIRNEFSGELKKKDDEIVALRKQLKGNEQVDNVVAMSSSSTEGGNMGSWFRGKK